MGALDGKVAIITGAGHGLGRAHAELFAREGARGIVINDLGVGLLGDAKSSDSVEETVALVREAGGDAVGYFGDCADWEAGREMVDLAIKTWGRLDILVNNAGILRDRMIFNLSEREWDDVIDVNLKGHFSATRHACVYWRDQAKAGQRVAGRVINTTSSAGLFGSAGQANYAAAKAGVIGLTRSVAIGMARYGVTCNVVSPMAETNPNIPIEGVPSALRNAMTAEQVSPLYAFLASDKAVDITGQIFLAAGGTINRIEPFRLVEGPIKRHGTWTVDEIAELFTGELAAETPEPAQAIRHRLAEKVLDVAR